MRSMPITRFYYAISRLRSCGRVVLLDASAPTSSTFELWRAAIYPFLLGDASANTTIFICQDTDKPMPPCHMIAATDTRRKHIYCAAIPFIFPYAVRGEDAADLSCVMKDCRDAQYYDTAYIFAVAGDFTMMSMPGIASARRGGARTCRPYASRLVCRS